MKLRRFVLAGLALLVGLPLLAVASVALFVDADDIASRAARAFTERTGQALTVRGASALTYFPSPGARVEDVELANPEDFSASPLASARVIRASATWTGLLRGDVHIASVEVDGLAVYLERRPDGAANWEALLGSARAADNAASAPPLSLARVQIEGARISYSDGAGGTPMALDGLDLVAGPVAPGLPLEAVVTTRVESPWTADKPELTARVKLVPRKEAAGATVEQLTVELSVDEPELRASAQYRPTGETALEFEVHAGVLDLDPYIHIPEAAGDARAPATPLNPAALIDALRAVSLSGRLEAKSLAARGQRVDDVVIGIAIARNEVRIAPIAARMGSGRIDAQWTVLADDQPLQFQARHALSGLRVDEAAERAGLDLPMTLGAGESTLGLTLEGRVAPDASTVVFSQVLLEGALSIADGGVRMLPLALHTKGALATGDATLYLPALRVSAGELTATGSAVSISTNDGAVRSSGLLATDSLDVRAFAQSIGLDLPATADATALRALSIDAGFAFENGVLTVDPATLVLDESTGTGQLRLDLGGSPAFDFSLDIDMLNADRYRPPNDGEDSGRDASGQPGPLALDELRALDANGTVTIGKLQAAGGTFDNVRLTLTSRGGEENAGEAHDAKAEER